MYLIDGMKPAGGCSGLQWQMPMSMLASLLTEKISIRSMPVMYEGYFIFLRSWTILHGIPSAGPSHSIAATAG